MPQPAGHIQVWAVDPLVKVFRDAEPSGGEALCEVARGECATWQIVVRSGRPIAGLRAAIGHFRRQEGGQANLGGAQARYVGYVPVDRPIHTPPSDQLRKPPADFPDPLLEKAAVDVAAGEAQPIWVSLPVPMDATPGAYEAELTISGQVGGEPQRIEVLLSLEVYDVAVGASRLWVTNWFFVNAAHLAVSAEPYSIAYWELLRRYARNMAAHRQNVALIPVLSLAEYRVGNDGELEIDFEHFDRWVEIFKEEGVVGRIEGGHLGGRSGGWQSQFVVRIKKVENGAVVDASVDPAGEEADRFYGRFLPALAAHLEERGWTECYAQHLADEPIAENIESYRAIASLVHRYAPGFKIMEACHTKDLVGAIDVWVPQLNYLHRDFGHYQNRQRAGEEVWFYTCIYPQGEYANRFIEQPLLKTRILHWINYRYGITGYLHWGYNHWRAESPFEHTTLSHDGTYLPAGDAWIVYPGETGPIDSIRFEAMRDGIADYELLCVLGDRNPEAARAIAARHVLDFDRYALDLSAFRETRRELLRLLVEAR
jgi:hypothetical protein